MEITYAKSPETFYGLLDCRGQQILPGVIHEDNQTVVLMVAGYEDRRSMV